MALTRYSKVTDYISSLYAKESDALKSLRTSLPTQQLAIQLSPSEGKLVSWLIKISQAQRVLEIGTLAGYSALWIAQALPPGGKLTTIEKSEAHFRAAQANINATEFANRIEVILGDALDVLESLAKKEETYDAVFIDANKAAYPEYLEKSYHLLKPGGLIIADNTLLFETVIDETPPPSGDHLWEAMRRFNAMLADQSKFDAVMIPTAEGLSVAIKKNHLPY